MLKTNRKNLSPTPQRQLRRLPNHRSLAFRQQEIMTEKTRKATRITDPITNHTKITARCFHSKQKVLWKRKVPLRWLPKVSAFCAAATITICLHQMISMFPFNKYATTVSKPVTQSSVSFVLLESARNISRWSE